MKFGKLNAILVYLAWLTLAASLFTLFAAFLDLHDNERAFFYLFGVFIFFSVAHAILSYFVRCPNCNRCITVQGFDQPHPDSDGSWQKTVLKWFSGRVRCIHCGRSVNTRGKFNQIN